MCIVRILSLIEPFIETGKVGREVANPLFSLTHIKFEIA